MAKYGPEAHQLVEREMKQLKKGKLRSGSGQKVTNPKQAIAIALSEARRSGTKMPEPPPGTASAEKAPADKRAAAKKKPTKESPAKSAAAAKKTPAKGAAAKKAAGKKAPSQSGTGKTPTSRSAE